MINDTQYGILQACHKFDRNPLSLIRDFGDATYKEIDILENLGLLKLEQGEGYSQSVIYYTLTEEGHKFMKDYCHACECIPCDCGYGN